MTNPFGNEPPIWEWFVPLRQMAIWQLFNPHHISIENIHAYIHTYIHIYMYMYCIAYHIIDHMYSSRVIYIYIFIKNHLNIIIYIFSHMYIYIFNTPDISVKKTFPWLFPSEALSSRWPSPAGRPAPSSAPWRSSATWPSTRGRCASDPWTTASSPTGCRTGMAGWRDGEGRIWCCYI